jgi:hypothetical protein
MWGALSVERTGLSFVRVTVNSISQLSICTVIYIFSSYQMFVYKIYLFVQAQYSRL